MFPTTLWSTIRQAAAQDRPALERFSEKYRPAIQAFLRQRGFDAAQTDDLCQDVFVRLLAGEVLSKADPDKGRFRSLLLAVTRHVVGDRLRRRTELTGLDAAAFDDSSKQENEFDRAWILHLSQIAMTRLQEQGSVYYAVLRDHLSGQPQDRNRLWIARRKLIALIRHEVALTCSSAAEFEEEIAHLSPYLRPREKSDQKE